MFDDLIRMGASAAGAYEIERSMRFNSGSTVRLSRTPSSAGNQRTWTWSAWIKRSTLTTVQDLFSAYDGSSAYNIIRIGSNDQLYFQSNTAAIKLTSAKFRDTTAWYHIVVAVDTTSGTAADRAIIYINGTRQSLETDNTITQNTDYFFNTTNAHTIGSYANGSSYPFDGYMTEINYIDGTILTPSSFGETDTDTGQWIPKKYAGAYGTNGFFLEFKDNSGTGATQMGKDTSGNGNNWTPHNISVSSSHYTEEDSMVDTPTNNYPILNTLDGYSTVSYVPLNGGLDYNINDTSEIGLSTIALPTSGKWYAECTPNALESVTFGIRDLAAAGNRGANVFSHGIIYLYTGHTWKNGSNIESVTAPASGNIMGCAVDRDNNTVQFSLNGTNVGNTIAMTTTEEYQWWVGRGASSGNQPTGSVNFGQRAFAHQPSGFIGLCTSKLPTPTIKKGIDHFNTMIYQGDGNASKNIAHGLAAAPDLWVGKTRSTTQDWIVSDTIRGVGNYVNFNGTGGDAGYGSISWNGTAPNATNIIVGENGGGWGTNQSGVDQVLYGWVGGGSGTSNSSGSVTSSVSANAAAGFSVVGWTGTTGVDTIGHGLGVAPEMIFVKKRSASDNWLVYSSGTSLMGADKQVYVDLSNSVETNTNIFNDAPSSTVFTVGSWSSTETMIAYCFASVKGYSKIDSYKGNTSSDGVFIYLGFKPALLMIKCISASDSWAVFDNRRSDSGGGNLIDKHLRLDTNGGEYDPGGNPFVGVDFCASGFKHRENNNQVNQNETYLYYAIAEQPVKYANAE